MGWIYKIFGVLFYLYRKIFLGKMKITKFDFLGDFFVFKHKGRIALVNKKGLFTLLNPTSEFERVLLHVQIKDDKGYINNRDEWGYVKDIEVCSIGEAADFFGENKARFIEEVL